MGGKLVNLESVLCSTCIHQHTLSLVNRSELGDGWLKRDITFSPPLHLPLQTTLACWGDVDMLLSWLPVVELWEGAGARRFRCGLWPPWELWWTLAVRDTTLLSSVTRTHNKTNILVRNYGVETTTLDCFGRVLLARKVLHTHCKQRAFRLTISK